MNELMQNSLALAACLAAALFVLWRAWKALAGRSGGCGTGCGSCSSATKGPQSKPLIQIGSDPPGA